MVTIMVITPPSPLCMQDSEVFGASAPYVISGNKLLTFLERLKDGLVRVKREGGGGRQQYSKGESTWEGGSEVRGGHRAGEAVHLDPTPPSSQVWRPSQNTGARPTKRMQLAAENEMMINTLKVWKNAASFVHKVQWALLLAEEPKKDAHQLLRQDTQLAARMTRKMRTSLQQLWSDRWVQIWQCFLEPLALMLL